MIKILLLGKNGQVGWELQRSLATLGEVIALDRNSTGYCGDLADLNGLATTIQVIMPEVVVNAAAYTAVDKAETDEVSAQLINSQAVEVLAKETAKLGALLVHFSTDYVFDGEGRHFREEDEKTNPLNIYGKTKREGEMTVSRYNPQHLIFRTSWVYAARGNNFAKTISALIKNKEALSVIDDQIGAPTGAELIADCTAIAIRKVLEHKDNYGIYHLVSSGETSWYGYAKYLHELLQQLGVPLVVKDISAVTSNAFPTTAKRPRNSRLSNRKLSSVFNINIPDWKHGISRLISELEDVK